MRHRTITVALLSIFASATAAQDRWRQVGCSSESCWYVDQRGTSRASATDVVAWIQMRYKKAQVHDSFTTYSMEQSYVRFRCGERRLRIEEWMRFDEKRRQVAQWKSLLPVAGWFRAAPETIADDLLDAACRGA